LYKIKLNILDQNSYIAYELWGSEARDGGARTRGY